MRYLICASVLALTACVSTTDVVPAGKDSYMVSGASHGGLSGGHEGVATLKTANAYCDARGKHMMIRSTESGNSMNFASLHLIFSCLDADDPEYQRPNLRKEPTTIIEDARR